MSEDSIITFLTSIQYWHWLILAFVFMTIELFMPGAMFLWTGIAAAAVALVILLMPKLIWQVQIVLFCAFSIISLFMWLYYRKKNPENTGYPHLNQRGHSFVGRTFTLVEAIENGRGTIKSEDSTWRVIGDDSPVGTQVKVVGVEGANLQVELVEKTTTP